MKILGSDDTVWRGGFSPGTKRQATGGSQNLAPVLVDAFGSAIAGEPVTFPVFDNAYDPEGQAMTVVAAMAMNGSVVIELDGQLTYTSEPGFLGTDTIAYTVEDAQGASSKGIITITVMAAVPGDEPPVAQPDTASVLAGDSVSIAVLANDTDPEGGALSVTAAQAQAGSVTVEADNTLTYTAPAAFSGTDTITYTIADAAGATSESTVAVTVMAANKPPVAQPDTASVLAGDSVSIAVLANDTDPEGGALSVTAAQAQAGSVTVEADNTLTYTAPAAFSGTDTITYTIADAAGATSESTVAVTVMAANKPPVAQPDTASVLAGDSVSIAVLANDTDPEGGALSVTAAQAQAGSVTVEADNTLTYTAPAAFSGTDTITYTIADAAGATSESTVAVTVVKLTVSESGTPGEFVITAAPGSLSVTIVEPAQYAGTYKLQTDDLTTGPLNLVPPQISGTAGDGEVLSGTPGLWISDEAHAPFSVGQQWMREGTAIQGETGTTYTIDVGLDGGKDLHLVETGSSSAGSRPASSGTIPVPTAPPAPSLKVWTPASLGSLKQWFDASDLATLVTSGTEVSDWKDKSGNGLDLTKAGSTGPSTGQTINKVPALLGNVDQFMESNANIGIAGTQDRTVMMAVGAWSGPHNSSRSLYALGMKTNRWMFRSQGGRARLDIVSDGADAPTAVDPFAAGLIGVSGTGNRLSGITFYSNGSVHPASSSSQAAINTLDTVSLVGHHVWQNNGFGFGLLGEIVVCNALLSDSDRQRLEGYLAHRWGFSAQLPASHPYRSTPPTV